MMPRPDDGQREIFSLTYGVSPHRLRQINREVVLTCLRNEGPLARVQLAVRTGLSRSAVGVIIEELLREGVVREGDALPATSQGGRRAILLHIVPGAG